MGSAPAEGSDAAIYPELARTNLLRMRGDYKAAIDHCRSILRKFPNNVSANQLLGDLTSENGDLQQAKEWYELALDIAPNNVQIQKKLSEVSRKLDQVETAGLVEKLGLPGERSKSGWIAVGVATAVVAVGAVAYVIGTNQPPKVASKPQYSSISAPTNTETQAVPPNETPAGTPPAAQPPATSSNEESALSQQIATQSQNGSRLIGVVLDPRTLQLTLTYRIEANDDARTIGAELAGVALDNHATTQLVTVRAIESGNLKFVADVRREAYEETKTDVWKQANGAEASAFAKHVISNEWPAVAPTEPSVQPDPSSGAPPPATTAGP
jgi:tetratricopeptide (TPR) repeat protein